MPFTAGHALVIGVGEYPHATDMNVPKTTADARALADVLRDPAACGYSPERVRVLTGAEATSAAILAALDALAGVAKTDTVTLFYSGHGHYGADGAYCLTSYDTELDARRRVVAGTAVSQRDMLVKLKAIPAERLLLVVNACHSGELSPVLDAGAEPPVLGTPLPEETADALLATGQGRIILAACRPRQYSFVGSGARTIFGQTLLDGLAGAIPGVIDRGGFISAFDLYLAMYDEVDRRVKEAVAADVRARYGGTQQPELTVLKGVGPFAVALYKGAAALGEPGELPPPERAAPAREVTREASEAAFSRLLAVGQGVAVAGDVSGGNLAGGDQTVVAGDLNSGDTIDARGAQGVITRPSGPVTQTFGDQISGDAGVFVSGGTINGPVVGVNRGSMSISYGGAPSQPQGAPTIRSVRDQLRAAIDAAAQAGDDALAGDLDGVEALLGEALQAERDGTQSQRARKLRQAAGDLEPLATASPALGEALRQLRQLAS